MKYPLLSNAFSKQDILEGQKVLKSKQITMSVKTKLFERKFAKYVGSKYALMVNSGSSANLLALSTKYPNFVADFGDLNDIAFELL